MKAGIALTLTLMLLPLLFIVTTKGHVWDFETDVRYKSFSFDRLDDLEEEVQQLQKELRHAEFKLSDWRKRARYLIGLQESSKRSSK